MAKIIVDMMGGDLAPIETVLAKTVKAMSDFERNGYNNV